LPTKALKFMLTIPSQTINFTLATPSVTLPWIVVIMGIVALMCLALAYRTWIGNTTHPSNIFYAIVSLMIMFWIFSLIGIRLAMDPVLISLSIRMSGIFGALIVFFFYIFTYHFAFKRFYLTKKQYALLFATTALIILISITPGYLVPGRVLPENRFDSESPLWGIVFTIYYIVIVFLAFRNLWTKYRNMDGIWRSRLRQIMIATSAPLLTGGIFGLILPTFSTAEFEWITVFCLVFMVVYIWYQIFWKTSQGVKKAQRPR